MLHSGKKFPAMRDKKKYSNSRVVRKMVGPLVGYNPRFPWKLYKEEINENIRLRKLPSIPLLLINYSVVYCYFMFKF